MPEEQQIRRERERQKQREQNDTEKRKRKKDRKKRKKREQKRRAKEIETGLQMIQRVMDRNKQIDDMNLRCYMILDKIILMIDIGRMVVSFLEDLPREADKKLINQIDNIQNEIKILMNWLINERSIDPKELTDPIPIFKNCRSRCEHDTDDDDNNNNNNYIEDI